MQGNVSISNRLNGLDTLRAFAIIIVLLYHYMVVVSNEYTFGYVTRIGWMGVDLFFVLSGYLIGNQILSAIANKENFSLKTFYIRRLLRTLPNYYAVFALYFIFPAMLTGIATAPVWKFLTFTQNFEFRPFATFSHSWSLCIEEQFYFIFPLIFILLAKVRHFVIWAWLVIIFAMFLGLAVRLYVWYTYGESSMDIRDYYQYIYYSSFTRFDELLPGIAIAMLKNFHPVQFVKMLKKSNLIFWVGVSIIGILFYLFPHYHSTQEHGYNLFLSTSGYSLVAIGFSLVTFAALSSTSLIGKIRIPGAAQLALWSYAIYLIHKPLFKLFIAPLTDMNIDVKSPMGVFIIMGLSLAAGWLLFRFVETPFMNLRSKYFPTNNLNVERVYTFK